MEGPRYRLIDRLGQGGMATVWRGEDRQLRREVAVKVLLPFVAERPEAQGRFEREARALATVHHPNVLEVYDFLHATADEPARLVLELLTGPSLQRFVVDSGALLPEVAALVGAEIGAGLAAVHARGIVHRDVKPENVMLDRHEGRGRVVLTDFGVAHVAAVEQSALTQTGAILGSPAYMSPEQARGDDVDARSDQFSLGSLIYWLATGAAPFSGSHPLAVMQKLERGELMPLGARNQHVPAWLERVVTRCMSRDRNDRFEDMTALVAALRRGLTDDGLGDPTVELRTYFAEPPAFNASLRERVVAARLEDARLAWKQRRRARAIASAMRVLQLDADHKEAQSFIDRRDRSRAVIVLATALAALTPVGLLLHTHHTGSAPPDLATAVVARTLEPEKREPVKVDPVVEAPTSDLGSVHAVVHVHHEKPKPVPFLPTPVATAPPPVEPTEQPAKTTAVLGVRTSPWCDLVIDDRPLGRTPQTVTLPLGAHHVVCQNPSGARLDRRVDLTADRDLEERLMADAVIAPRLGAANTYSVDSGQPLTGPTHVTAGRHRVTIVREGAPPETRWVDIPARGCALGTDLRCEP